MASFFVAESSGIAYLCLGILSLLIGSLLNVIIYRLPHMLQAEWRLECSQLLNQPVKEETRINLFFPRSFCPSCKHLIPIWHNIPLLSYCILRGRCNQCQHNISWHYPMVEFLSLILSLLAAWHFGFHVTLLFALIFIWIMLVISMIDLKHQIVPDSLSLSLLWLGLIANTNALWTTLPASVWGAIVGYMSLWLFMRLFYLMTGKIGMGHGDFKLFAALGAWFGSMLLPFILVGASLLGAIIGIGYLHSTKKNKDTPIPFGPFLCLLGLVSLFYGSSILEHYHRLILNLG